MLNEEGAAGEGAPCGNAGDGRGAALDRRTKAFLGWGEQEEGAGAGQLCLAERGHVQPRRSAHDVLPSLSLQSRAVRDAKKCREGGKRSRDAQ